MRAGVAAIASIPARSIPTEVTQQEKTRRRQTGFDEIFNQGSSRLRMRFTLRISLIMDCTEIQLQVTRHGLAGETGSSDLNMTVDLM